MVFFGFKTVIKTVILTVCSLTREERRKRNVGGIVCGSLRVLCFKIFLQEYGGTFFLEKMLIPDLIIDY